MLMFLAGCGVGVLFGTFLVALVVAASERGDDEY